MPAMLSTRRRDFLSTLFLALGMSVTARAAAAQTGSSGLGACAAVTGPSDHGPALAAALKAARDGVASEAVRAAIAANRCPFCGCSLMDPFTGKPMAKHSAS
ncbi:MAG: hypothetical protein ACOVVK_06670 [Elsteraceae bacterium]